MPIDILRISIRDQDRLVASVPGPSLLYAVDGPGRAVSLPTVAANEVVEISLPTVASLLPVVSLPTVAAETLLVVSLPTVATNEVAESSLPPVASLLPAVSLPTDSIRTIDGLDSSSSSDGGSSEFSQSNNKSRKRSRSPSADRRGNFKKPTSRRSDNN